MFVPRRFTAAIPRYSATLLCVVAISNFVEALAVAHSTDAWRAFGSAPQFTAPANSNTTATQDWQLPNHKKPAANVASSNQQAVSPANPLRQQQPAKFAQAPARFQAPASAAPMPKPQAAVAHPATMRQPQGPSAAVATTSVTTAPVRQASAANWQMPTGRPAMRNQPASNYWTPNQQTAHRVSQPSVAASSPSAWQTISVAFEGDTENLPAPTSSKSTRPSTSRSQADVEFSEPFQDDVFHPYGAPGGYGGGSCTCDGNCQCGGGCEPGCGCACGDACDPGCGCEPGCGCGQGGCRNEEFCIGPGDDESCHTVRVRWPKWQEVMVFGGVQGFKGPYDQNRDSGNFGFHEGFNIGAKIPYSQAGYQFGYRALQNQLNGDEATGIDHQQFQQFATAGLFHRSCNGLQGGVVWDHLNDERFSSLGYNQLRSELSLISCGTHEYGLSATFGLNDHELVEFDNSTQVPGEIHRFWEPTDQYLLFYRLHGCNGGEGRFYAGANEDGEAILGSDFLLPLGESFSMQGGFTYLIPDAPDGSEGASKEAWNVGLGLVWHFHNQARKCHKNCYRPLFNVADNGYLIVHEGPGGFEVDDD
jgi:hypothetical protein